MSHLAMELMRLKTGIKVTHLPYKGAAPRPSD
jgi:tripartite-type tricarboxylate transporter receptor subunit TctC